MKINAMSTVKVSNFKLILTEEDKAFILSKMGEVLASHRWTLGLVGEAFEKTFKEYTGAANAVALSNGGVALIAILQALKIPEGSVVICPTLTAPPTPHAILAANMKVVFADSNPDDLGLDPEDLELKLKQYKDQVGAVIAVHVGGWISPRIKQLHEICQKRGIPLIEDCAHAHGSWLEGRHAGSTTGIAAYSFFMTKPLASGEGGIVTLGDASLAEIIRIIRNYGKNGQGKHVMKGFNYKLSEFDAVVALWASRNAQRLADERRKIAAIYDQMLEDMEKIQIIKVPQCQSSYYKYVITLDAGISKDSIRESWLKDYGIEAAGGVYDTLCHEEPYFQSIPEKVLNSQESFPKAEGFARKQLCLPLYPGLTEGEQRLVVESLRSVLKASPVAHQS